MARHRLVFKQVEILPIDNTLIEAQVTLALQDSTYTGTARGQADQSNTTDEPVPQLKLAVEATLDALTQALKRPIKFQISDVAEREMNGMKQKFIVVLLKTDYFIQPVGEAVELLGACQLSGSVVEAAVRATLNATNRTISLLLK